MPLSVFARCRAILCLFAFVGCLALAPPPATAQYVERTGGDNPLSSIPATSTPAAVDALVGDFDTDGDPDLLAYDGTAEVYYQNDGGTFTAIDATATPFRNLSGAAFETRSNTFVLDVDGDADVDIVSFVYQSDGQGTLTLLENTDGATYAVAAPNPFDGVSVSGTSATVDAIMGDFGGPPAPDLLVFDGTNEVYYENDGTGAFVQQSGTDNPFDGLGQAFGTKATTVVSDLDGDGDLDLAFHGGATPTDWRYAENVDGQDQFVARTGTDNPLASVGVDATAQSIAAVVGDFNGDGSPDLLVYDGAQRLYSRDATGAFVEQTTTLFDAAPVALQVKANTFTRDFDGDSDLDLAFAEADALRYIEGNTPNAAPVATDDSETTDEDTAVSIDVLANDTDADGNDTLDPSTVTVASAPTNGTPSVDGSTGAITYTPDADFNGSDRFTYTVADVEGATSNAATVDVTVLAVPDVTLGGGTFTPPGVEPGTSNNPVGRIAVRADEAGASITNLTITLNGTNQGVTGIGLWQSSDDTFSASTDTNVASEALTPSPSGVAPEQTPGTVTFGGITGLDVTPTQQHLFITVDLAADAAGDLTVSLADPSAITLSGRATLTNVSGDFPLETADPSAGGALPVELTVFTAQRDGDGALLTWATASEHDNAGFEVQRLNGPPGSDRYEALGFVEGAGTTTRAQTYRFAIERLPVGTHRFRLKQVDTDGAFAFSDVAALDVTINKTYRLVAPHPNPARGSATLRLAVEQAQVVAVTVYDLLGRTVETAFRGTVPAQTERSIRVGDGLPAGSYFVRITGARFQATKRLTVVR